MKMKNISFTRARVFFYVAVLADRDVIPKPLSRQILTPNPPFVVGPSSSLPQSLILDVYKCRTRQQKYVKILQDKNMNSFECRGVNTCI